MIYRNKKVKDVYTEELLFEVIQRSVSSISTDQLCGWEERIVKIGQDHSAAILLPTTNREALYNIVAEIESIREAQTL